MIPVCCGGKRDKYLLVAMQRRGQDPASLQVFLAADAVGLLDPTGDLGVELRGFGDAQEVDMGFGGVSRGG